MERERKWDSDPSLQQQVLEWTEPLRIDGRKLEMDARYYDTADGLLAGLHAGLRLRLENGLGICCLKCGGHTDENGLHVREEYECPAATIADGLLGLAQTDAPPLIPAMLQQKGVVEICRIRFTRLALLLRQLDSDGELLVTAELALDYGTLYGSAHSAPLCEIELEYKSGDTQAFDALADELAATFGLVAQPLSKLARAAAL